MINKEQIGESWYPLLSPFLEDNFGSIARVIKESKGNKPVCPLFEDTFNAFKLTPYNKVRVVIFGLAPYHTILNGKPVANGLAFSYKAETPFVPPSLRNVFKELERSYDALILDQETDLTNWANQGVLLLNTALTTLQGEPNAHGPIWKPFIVEVLRVLRNSPGTIYVFWGKDAQEFIPNIDEKNNYILTCGHPSPLNTKNPFVGSNIFKQIDEITNNNNNEVIKWF